MSCCSTCRARWPPRAGEPALVFCTRPALFHPRPSSVPFRLLGLICSLLQIAKSPHQRLSWPAAAAAPSRASSRRKGKGACAAAAGRRYAREFFTRDGRLRHIHRLHYWPLDRVLREKYKLPAGEVRNLCVLRGISASCAESASDAGGSEASGGISLGLGAAGRVQDACRRARRESARNLHAHIAPRSLRGPAQHAAVRTFHCTLHLHALHGRAAPWGSCAAMTATNKYMLDYRSLAPLGPT